MKISSFIAIILFSLLSVLYSSAQENTGGAYSIGDKFPDYTFNAVNRDSSFKFTLDSYKGKSIIIDLWDVHCAGCISSMSRLDSLQHLFAETLQIILVTKNSKEQVDGLFSRKNIRRPDLPIVVSDTILYDIFFPHDGDPLHVWIDSSGVIKYITAGYNTTSENIRKFMYNEPLNVSYQTKLKDFDGSKPLIEEAAKRLKFYTAAYSLFTAGLHNIVNTNRIEIIRDEVTGRPYSIKALNAPLLTLYQIAFNPDLYGVELNMFRLVKNNRIVLDSKRAESLNMPKEIEYLDSWKNNNSYCYELFLPLENSDQIFRWMQQDLQRFFNLKTFIQKRKTNCLILANIKTTIESKGLSDKRPVQHSNNPKPSTYQKREQMATLVKEIIYLTQDFNLPFVDETTNNTSLLIKLPSKVNSIVELNGILNECGLRLTTEMREVDLLIIK